ncbi:hypothetical protein EV383_1428 [Pseudonocardia sediminis]|uniref:Uncharacterized protein n=1 Tax=Pseudonocardia sediminis TaxID=1397368 RepID=A0A4Q7UUT0_PSEST|nr:hypothetical protein [Pseudonocardia sediminis]RZT84581.1 hypothetical protein EV383_1428 [Pseudonocardia sediminis]
MPRNRARSTARRIVGGAALAGSALVGLSGAAQAATPDLVPDLAPYLTEHNEVQPDPAPTAPPVESSFTAFDSTDPVQQLRDFTPAGVPAAGLVDSLGDVPKKITPTFGGGGSGSGAGYE